MGIKILILDHNSFSLLKGFPKMPQLENLSIAYNQLRDLNQVLVTISENFPSIKHLNLIKNPINPMFSGGQDAYEKFRATVKIWVPSLQTLDGTAFTNDN